MCVDLFCLITTLHSYPAHLQRDLARFADMKTKKLLTSLVSARTSEIRRHEIRRLKHKSQSYVVQKKNYGSTENSTTRMQFGTRDYSSSRSRSPTKSKSPSKSKSFSPTRTLSRSQTLPQIKTAPSSPTKLQQSNPPVAGS